jgi:hypothetical protein
MSELLSVGATMGAVLFWLLAVPVCAWLLWYMVATAWRLALWLIETLCTGIAALLMLVWQPIGWLVAGGEWVMRWMRRRAA